MNEETLARAIKKRQATCQKIGFFRDTFVARVRSVKHALPVLFLRLKPSWAMVGVKRTSAAR
jgi:hypothetical protein